MGMIWKPGDIDNRLYASSTEFQTRINKIEKYNH